MNIIVPLTAGQTLSVEQGVAHEAYLLRVLVALDEAANTILGGQADETISSHAAILAQKHELIGSTLSRLLDFAQKNHGALACATDYARAEAECARLKESGLISP